ncbi:hypothetical protein AGMMS4956_12970 [Bacteroidia bacterium]|nr:hypothetical protein AGMMS4956_12970 [Bacteroidia bacterium]
MSGCDITDRVPENAITDLNYWGKVDDLRMYARNLYSQLPGPVGGSRYPDESKTDIVVEAVPSDYLLDAFTVPTDDNGWAYADWSPIRNCNYFLTHYQTVVGDEQEIKHYVGEVRFFRALLYFNKVKDFGDVPWYETDLQTSDQAELTKPRDPRLTVIANIKADLEYAITNMKKPSDVMSGQLHKDAALALLARVMLYEGTWQKYRNASPTVWQPLLESAAATAKRIMDGENGKTYEITKGTAPYTVSGYPLNYKAKFIQANKSNDPECILARIYSDETGVMHGLSRITSKGLSKDFVDQFLCTDGLPISISTSYMGDDSINSELENRDPRLRNILDCKYNPFILAGGTVSVNNPLLPTSVTEVETVTGYRSIKYREPDNIEPNKTAYDWYVFRYAEILLIYAEALAELGGEARCTQTVVDETINKLRERLDESSLTMARMSIASLQDDPMEQYNGQYRYGYDLSKLLYEIRRERTVELAFDGFRWDDICRWKAGALFNNPKSMCGIVINADVRARYAAAAGGTDPFASANLLSSTEQLAGVSATRDLLRAYSSGVEDRHVWNDRNYLRPLPKNQILLNPNLTQNCGWDGGSACP